MHNSITGNLWKLSNGETWLGQNLYTFLGFKYPFLKCLNFLSSRVLLFYKHLSYEKCVRIIAVYHLILEENFPNRFNSHYAQICCWDCIESAKNCKLCSEQHGIKALLCSDNKRMHVFFDIAF